VGRDIAGNINKKGGEERILALLSQKRRTKEKGEMPSHQNGYLKERGKEKDRGRSLDGRGGGEKKSNHLPANEEENLPIPCKK